MIYLILFVTLVCAWSLLRRRVRVLARRAEAAYPPEGAFVTVGGCRLHYLRQGSGLPVVLLHGSDGFLQDFAPVLHAPSADAFDLIAFDRPGHGHSEAPEKDGGTLPTQVHLLHSALQQLGVERPVLVGHSWSGALALAYALEYPEEVAGLTLLAPWVYPTSDPPPRLLYAARLVGAPLSHLVLALTPMKRRLLHRSLKQAFAPDAVPPDYARRAAALWQRSARQVGVFLEENADTWERLRTLSPRYPDLATPLVIVTGDSDSAVHAEHQALRLHRELPRSELIVVPQTGHELPHLRPEVVLDAIGHCRQAASTVTTGQTERHEEKEALSPAETEGGLRRRARELVFRFGWNATAYQILNPDMEYWFSADGEAVVGYVRRFKTRVAAGAPVCEERRLAEVAAAFEREAEAGGERVCWFAAATRMLNMFAERPPHAALVIGAQPVWNPTRWPEILAKTSSLRAQLNRARNKGVTGAEWPPERAANNPDLQRCLDEWVAHHPFPTLHFLTEPVTLDRLTDRRVFVAEVTEKPVGFLIATPVPSRSGWLVEQIVRGEQAPNGVSELLVDAAMRALAESGCVYVTLGLVPLTRRGRIPPSPPRLWLRAILTWARLHGQRFYNFEGLDAFKAKFKPETWEPLFAIANEPHISPRTLMAIAAAFSDGPLIWTAARALAAAARQEALWLARRLTTKPS